MATIADKQVVPPAPCPATLTAGRDRWESQTLNILVHLNVPWWLIHQLGNDNWGTAAQFADRWNSVTDLVAVAHTELQFADGTNGYNANTQRHATAALKRAWLAVCKNLEAHTTATLQDPRADPALVMMGGHRESLEKAWEQQTGGSKPPLDEQGSDTFMGAVYKEVLKSNPGTWTTKEIVSKVPDANTFLTTIKRRNKDIDGKLMEYETKERSTIPTDIES